MGLAGLAWRLLVCVHGPGRAPRAPHVGGNEVETAARHAMVILVGLAGNRNVPAVANDEHKNQVVRQRNAAFSTLRQYRFAPNACTCISELI